MVENDVRDNVGPGAGSSIPRWSWAVFSIAFCTAEPAAIRPQPVIGLCCCTRCQHWTGGPGLPFVVVASAQFGQLSVVYPPSPVGTYTRTTHLGASFELGN